MADFLLCLVSTVTIFSSTILLWLKKACLNFVVCVVTCSLAGFVGSMSSWCHNYDLYRYLEANKVESRERRRVVGQLKVKMNDLNQRLRKYINSVHVASFTGFSASISMLLFFTFQE